jgi:hypothetical protein
MPRDEPILVTTAATSPAEERDTRQRRYLLTMGLRVLCIIVAIVFARISWIVSAVAVAGSLVLPWVAVIAANAPKRSSRSGNTPTLYDGKRRSELGDR